MEFSLIAILWIIFSLVQVIAEKTRPTKLPPETDSEFEIPTLANAPTQSAQVQSINLAELYQRHKPPAKAPQPVQATPAVVEKDTDFELELTPESAMSAVIMSEILGKPKALRRR